MNTTTINQLLKRSIRTIVIYLVVFALFKLLDHFFPAGMCNPGISLFLLFALYLIIPPFFIYNLVEGVKGNRSNLISSAIHFFAFLFLHFVL
jgi:hypothetical protein